MYCLLGLSEKQPKKNTIIIGVYTRLPKIGHKSTVQSTILFIIILVAELKIKYRNMNN